MCLFHGFSVCFSFIFLHLGIVYSVTIALHKCPDRFPAIICICFLLCIFKKNGVSDLIIIFVESRLLRKFVRRNRGVDSRVSVS